MRVRWMADAADDLNRICDYLADTNADTAQRTAQTIVDGVASLKPSRIVAAWPSCGHT